ncbi:MAG TPA: hypothetical protein VM692_00795 [Gammaproteobacteria bacterium]|nr:hypothetical protein [Gammaproteobacteria bacterium]
MLNRRDVLRTAAVLPAWALTALPFARAAAASAGVLTLERFIFDVRFAEAGAIAAQVEQRGVELAPIADDLMTLWYDDLDLAWREAPMALAGVTLVEALFVLETFALDRGMHVVFRGEHGLVENGKVTHRFAGPAPVVQQLSPLPRQWKAAVAKALTECPLGAPEIVRTQAVSDGAALSLRDMPLVSWIIAPRAAVASKVVS